jgi:hypothetical protein
MAPAAAPSASQGASGAASPFQERRPPPPSLPPEDDEERRGQRCRDGLAEEREAEEECSRSVPCGAAPRVKAEVGQCRGQVEDRREGVLLLRDPRDGFDAGRMEGEGAGRKERARDREPPKSHPQEPGRGPMQRHVEPVVAGSRVSPKAELQPERAVEEGVVLLGGAGLGPDPPETVQRGQLRSDQVGVVVPDEAGVPYPKVGDERGGHEEQARQQDRGRPRAGGGGGAGGVSYATCGSFECA